MLAASSGWGLSPGVMLMVLFVVLLGKRCKAFIHSVIVSKCIGVLVLCVYRLLVEQRLALSVGDKKHRIVGLFRAI